MFIHTYNSIISVENLLFIWEKFICGKRNKKDVIQFQFELGTNIRYLNMDLKDKVYTHGAYEAFNISDPKPRNIHKATVRDRVVHHLVYKELYPYFHKRFIFDSYSCRNRKGTHRALDRFNDFARKVSENHTQTCFVLKCDIKKFFANIDHTTLIKILERHILDVDILWLIKKILGSFYSTIDGVSKANVGLPLGNLTSQLLVNIYMHEFDMFMKQELMVKYYIRYADDFVILSNDKKYLEDILPKMHKFLDEKLHLMMHENKVYIKTYDSGVDFLGWIHFPYHRQIRTTTKKKVARMLRHYPKQETVNSYRGLLAHGNTYKFKKRIGLTF
ncbi:MAG: group II intron reverse transcriptase domain-containing protein [Candidatus Pacebacteria bacterium]|nr:group II intron reverse transcriptase domain-containing protein [Candidatus Paceibacterota bacterium]MBP9818818.1 group II intron reverse transcriptase domain-containing protein [Candidatus Paceibacterota bacterium]